MIEGKCSNPSFALLSCHKTKNVEKERSPFFQTASAPIFTYRHESWVVIERVRPQEQACEMRFLRKIKRLTLFNKVRSFEFQKSLNIEPLLLRIERSQFKRFGHVSRMPHEQPLKQASLPKQMGYDPLDDLDLDEPITLRILNGIAWYSIQAK